MNRILVVEASPTLRYVLSKTLKRYEFEVLECDDPGEALDYIEVAETLEGIVLGWPNVPPPGAESLLARLGRPEHEGLPSVFLVHEPNVELLHWTSRRPRSAVVSWETYSEAADTLRLFLEPGAEPDLHRSSSAPRLRVLVVDDSRSFRFYYARLLSRHGYAVDTASGVAEALELVDRSSYDIAIVDYFMPEQNGHVLCQLLRDDPRTAHIRTAVVTGTYLDEVITDCLGAGATECLFKNEGEQLFLARVDALARLVEGQKAVEAQRSHLAAILASVGDGVFGVDCSGAITFMNSAALSILGLENEDAVRGGLAQALLHPTDVSGQPVALDRCPLHTAYVSGHSISGIGTAFHHRDSRLIPVDCTVQPLLLDGVRQGSVVAFRDMSERRNLEARVHWQATHDPLTELFNRGYFEQQLETEVRRVQRVGGNGGLLHIDLDQFRYLNEASGHQAGDQLLAEISGKLQQYVRHRDLLARLDGDEFAVLLRDLRPAQIMTVAEGLRDDLQSCSFEADGKRYRISASIGVALLHQGVTSAGALIAEADGACQVAKRKGRNQVHLFDPLSDNPAARGEGLGWTHRLGNALRDHLFVLQYQPMMAMEDIDVRALGTQPGRLWASQKARHEHYEVLLRLRGDHGEMISPQVFVPIAERYNLMPEIDLWVIGQVLDRLRALTTEGRDSVTLLVNLSAKTLATPSMLPRVSGLLASSGVAPARLIFEVTETSEIEDLNVARRFIQELRALGYRFALDDFGSGFCSFSQVKHLPADMVKVDGHFVQGMARDAIDGSIVMAIHDIAHSLGLLTVAEHVESAEVLRLLKAGGIDFVQGHYIAHPSSEIVPSGTGRDSAPLRLVYQPRVG